MVKTNIILKTDSYKLTHWKQYPVGTEAVYSYFESRQGAQFQETVFFGLQALLKEYFEGMVVDETMLLEARDLAHAHFGNDEYFNFKGWLHIIQKHGGKLPLRIKAVPEGTVVPVGNVMMTVENTDPECFWLTNVVETMLTHVWYPSTVATLSRAVKKSFSQFLEDTSDNPAGIAFMLHDFGFRGVSSLESAAAGGAAHLVNFCGTDTLAAMEHALAFYNADLETLAFSVAATEHSIMTALGENGEEQIVGQLLRDYQTGILSVVADSYNIYHFVDHILGKVYREKILAREGVFVVRPDSVTPEHPTPESEVLWILEHLYAAFGGEINSKGYKVLDSHIRVLWGDGIDQAGIYRICAVAKNNGFSIENLVFGMGGGLLQKVNRDTQRFAFKSSSQKRDGLWYDVFKQPRDASKASKKGKLKLVMHDGVMGTVPEGLAVSKEDLLQVVFENGKLVNEQTFSEIRERAAIQQAVRV